MSTLFQEFTGLKGHTTSRVLNIKGFWVLRDSGFPMLSRALKEVDVSIIQSFRVHGMEDFQGLKARGLEGERAPRFS